ncbi:MAG TPA: serine/threonine-protein kinase [Gemmatimonadales bacterium]
MGLLGSTYSPGASQQGYFGGDVEPAPSLTRAVLDAAADPAAARMDAITLRFASRVLERAFKEEYERESIRTIRIALAMGVSLVVAFGILDVIMQGPVRRELWLIRYGLLTPTVALVLALTFTRWALRYIEWILAVMVLVIGAGITAMILIAPPPGRYFYYAGLILVVMYDLTCLRLRFAVASVVACAVVGLYVGVELFVGQTPWPILTNNLFFFVSATVIGMFAAYFLESLARRNFVQDKLVRRAREFGSYRLVAPLGGGGMGEVWKAEHRFLVRPAAIKLIRAEMLGPSDAEERRTTLRRFEREAQATALLRSPHTIQLYDFGVTDEGTFYYVMELLEGFDLQTLVQRFGPLPASRVVHLLGQLCHSLAEAHEQGLIHRDIKPANIYVCRYGRTTDFVKVLDFGLVRSQHGREPKDLTVPTNFTVTQEGVAGTPSFMAPEQIAGDRPLDARTDIYGVGCVAYWLLTGRHVFEATTAVEMMAHHLETPAAPPSTRTTQVIPTDLEAVVLACVEKEPDRRPQTAVALADRLAASGDGASWSEARAQSWWNEYAPRGTAEAWTGETRLVMPTLVQP